MPYITYMDERFSQPVMIDTFAGYNHNAKIADGEWYTMQNLSSDHFPLMGTRKQRGVISTLHNPVCFVGKSKLAYIDGTSLYYAGQDVTEYITGKGLFISRETPKQMVSMGAYLCIFPDCLYFNTENYTDCGSMNAYFTATGEISYTLCKQDGTSYGETSVSPVAPEKPTDGQLWIDTSDVKHTLNQYSAATASWQEISTPYVKISYPGIGVQFAQMDGVNISGCDTADEEIKKQVAELNGSKIIYARDDDFIVVIGLLDKAFTQVGTVNIKREAPSMDYVTEADNRIWGCKYGLVGGKAINEIYCCALGDFKNWEQYLGVSTDSYRASVGTDGRFTGAITHLGHPLFFKEHCLHKVFVSPVGAHQIQDTICRGVQYGSNASLAVVGEILYYKSINDVCAYDGSLPVSVSEPLGDERYRNAIAGVYRDKYYIAMDDWQGNHNIFAYDTRKHLWHREDATGIKFMASCDGELYFIDSDNNMVSVSGNEGAKEGSFEWSAESGLQGYETIGQKYVSRFNVRMSLPEGSEMHIELEYDSDGVWHDGGTIVGTGTKSFLLPIRPRRCDHYKYRLSGIGPVKIYSVSKVFEGGSDGD